MPQVLEIFLIELKRSIRRETNGVALSESTQSGGLKRDGIAAGLRARWRALY